MINDKLQDLVNKQAEDEGMKKKIGDLTLKEYAKIWNDCDNKCKNCPFKKLLGCEFYDIIKNSLDIEIEIPD